MPDEQRNPFQEYQVNSRIHFCSLFIRSCLWFLKLCRVCILKPLHFLDMKGDVRLEGSARLLFLSLMFTSIFICKHFNCESLMYLPILFHAVLLLMHMIAYTRITLIVAAQQESAGSLNSVGLFSSLQLFLQL